MTTWVSHQLTVPNPPCSTCPGKTEQLLPTRESLTCRLTGEGRARAGKGLLLILPGYWPFPVLASWLVIQHGDFLWHCPPAEFSRTVPWWCLGLGTTFLCPPEVDTACPRPCTLLWCPDPPASIHRQFWKQFLPCPTTVEQFASGRHLCCLKDFNITFSKKAWTLILRNDLSFSVFPWSKAEKDFRPLCVCVHSFSFLSLIPL